jgi:hypothetical protein
MNMDLSLIGTNAAAAEAGGRISLDLPRTKASTASSEDPVASARPDLSAAAGILTGLMISAAFWAAASYTIHMLLR